MYMFTVQYTLIKPLFQGMQFRFVPTSWSEEIPQCILLVECLVFVTREFRLQRQDDIWRLETRP